MRIILQKADFWKIFNNVSEDLITEEGLQDTYLKKPLIKKATYRRILMKENLSLILIRKNKDSVSS